MEIEELNFPAENSIVKIHGLAPVGGLAPFSIKFYDEEDNIIDSKHVKIERNSNGKQLYYSPYICNKKTCEKLGKQDSYPANNFIQTQSLYYSSYKYSDNPSNFKNFIKNNMDFLVCFKETNPSQLFDAHLNEVSEEAYLKAVKDKEEHEILIPKEIYVHYLIREEKEESDFLNLDAINIGINFQSLFLKSLRSAVDKLDKDKSENEKL